MAKWKAPLGWALVVAAIVIGGVSIWRWRAAHKQPEVTYKTAPIERRRITARVTATGTLSATVTVQVGSQVSGRIQELFVDFNSPVKKGQVIAKIDPQLFMAAVAQARANYNQGRAQVAKAEVDALNLDKIAARTKALHDQNLASQQDLDVAITNAADAHANVDLQKASLDQAAAQLHQSEVNLSYTTIVSPIDGTVISRNVDVGQTVAASLQAPVLYSIAEDLRKMQVNTNIAEGDVGRLEPGMSAYFTVDAFPGQRFNAVISQIRNAATTVQNVVTYDAVLDVRNDDLRLRPGMTANVTIVYAQRDGALAIANTALRWRPAGTAASAAPRASGSGGRAWTPGASGSGRGRGRRAQAAEANGDDAGAARVPRVRDAGADGGDAGGETWSLPANPAPADVPEERTIWLLRGDAPSPAVVHVGLSDGTVTEIVDGDVKEGDLAITDSSGPDGTSSAAGASSRGGGGANFRRMF